MSKLMYGIAPTSVKLRVKLMDSSKTDGSGLTGLAYNSSGLIISTIQNVRGDAGEASATVYTSAASNIETITTIGTYAAPSTNKCRFKEVDATNHHGVYEIQIADARFANGTNPITLLVSVSGATNLAQCDVEIECQNVSVNAIQVNGTAQTARDLGANIDTTVSSRLATSGYTAPDNTSISAIKTKTDNLPASPASTTNITAGTITNVTNLTNAPTAGDFTSTMKTSLNAATPASVQNISAQTGDAYAIVNNATYGNAAIKTNTDTLITDDGHIINSLASISSFTLAILNKCPDHYIMGSSVKSDKDDEIDAIKTKTDNLPASPASTTNITAGTITNVTNLTNAPTAGDFTSTMKTSLNAATPASVQNISAQTGDAYAIVNNATYGNAAIKTNTDTIKAKTDNLPSSPAAVGSAMTLAANAVDASQFTQAAADKVWTSTLNGRTLTSGGSGTMDANLISIDGKATNGYNATLKLKQLDIENSNGSAIVAHATSGDGYGIEVNGSGVCAGIYAKGGANGAGIYASGGNASGHGIWAEGVVNGDGIYAVGGNTSGHGIRADGKGTGSGMYLLKGASGHDLTFATPDCTMLNELVEDDGQILIDLACITDQLSDIYAKCPDNYIMGSGVTTNKDDEIDAIKAKTDQLAFTGGYVQGQVKGMDTDVISAAAVSAAAVTKIQTGLALSGDMTTINGKLDTIYTTEGMILNDVAAVSINVTDIVSVLPSTGRISNLALTDEIDGGITFGNVLTSVLSMTSGRFKKDYPTSGQVTFYKRDNSTTAFVMSVTDTERTRI